MFSATVLVFETALKAGECFAISTLEAVVEWFSTQLFFVKSAIANLMAVAWVVPVGCPDQ